MPVLTVICPWWYHTLTEENGGCQGRRYMREGKQRASCSPMAQEGTQHCARPWEPKESFLTVVSPSPQLWSSLQHTDLLLLKCFSTRWHDLDLDRSLGCKTHLPRPCDLGRISATGQPIQTLILPHLTHMQTAFYSVLSTLSKIVFLTYFWDKFPLFCNRWV